MNSYTFTFSGYITVKAKTCGEALKIASDLVTPSTDMCNSCEDVFIGDLELSETTESLVGYWIYNNATKALEFVPTIIEADMIESGVAWND